MKKELLRELLGLAENLDVEALAFLVRMARREIWDKELSDRNKQTGADMGA